MHACIAECALQGAPAIPCLLAPLRQPAANHTPEAPSSTFQGRGCRSCSTSHQRIFAFNFLFTQQLTPSIELALGIPSQWELCKSVGSAASWDGPQVDCGVPGTGTPRPQTKQGHPQKYADEVCRLELFGGPEVAGLGKSKVCGISALKLCLLHPRSPKLDRPSKKLCLASMPSFCADGKLAGLGQELLTKLIANFSTAPVTASHTPRTLQGCLNFLFGRLAKVSGRGLRWAGRGSRCELNREKGKPTPHEWDFAKETREGACLAM
eukprot:1155955-Pelagomonas_calceolata.AAC.3